MTDDGELATILTFSRILLLRRSARRVLYRLRLVVVCFDYWKHQCETFGGNLLNCLIKFDYFAAPADEYFILSDDRRRLHASDGLSRLSEPSLDHSADRTDLSAVHRLLLLAAVGEGKPSAQGEPGESQSTRASSSICCSCCCSSAGDKRPKRSRGSLKLT